MPTKWMQPLRKSIAQFDRLVTQEMPGWTKARTPEAFMAVEQAAHQAARELVDAVVATVLRSVVKDPIFETACMAKAVASERFRPNRRRRTKVTLLGGNTHEFETPYMVAVKSRRQKKPQRGLWPCLAALGVTEHVSPAVSSEVCRQITESCSLRDGLTTLQRRGIELGYKRSLRLFQRFGQAAVEQRTAWADAVGSRHAKSSLQALAGKTVLVCVDGGRLRERCVKKGRRRDTGHHRYDAPWREPRQLVVCVLDKHGKPDRRFLSLYDATLQNADGFLLLVWAYLEALGASHAKRVVFAADGAEWIWRRTAVLRMALRLPEQRFVEVIDWSHAVSMLHTIAKTNASWSEAEQRRWVKEQTPHLHAGDIDQVVEAIKKLARGRRGRAVSKHIAYFENNAHRMQYATLQAWRLPRGSGVVESAIRRVVNLRLKSPGKFWLRENAEATLHLRSYLKAGHWDQLATRTVTAAIPWNNIDDHFLPNLRVVS